MPKRMQVKHSAIYVGIDPGALGAIALVSESNSPVTYPLKDLTESEIIAVLQTSGITHAYLEWIHPAIQGIAKSSMSKLYGSYKSLAMALTATGVPHEIIQPKKWQAGMGVIRQKSDDYAQWKKKLRQHAQMIWPRLAVSKDTADALLIAEWCRRQQK